MNPIPDPYQVLGISPTATLTEVRKAFRKLSLKHHPDSDHRSSEASADIFRKVNDAYNMIDTEEKRSAYDAKHCKQETPAHVKQSGPPLSQQQLIQMFMNGMGAVQQGVEERNSSVQRLGYIDHEIELTMAQCYYGCEFPLAIERSIHRIDETGVLVREKEQETIYVSVSPGIDDGEMIIVEEKGHVDTRGVQGDVRVKIRILNETDFQRHGLDLKMKKSLTLKDALCGFDFSIRHVSGQTYNIKRQAVVPIGFQQRIPNLGMKRGDHVGSLIVHFDIVMPVELTEEQKSELRDIL